jgi:L-arabinose transport system substrate-binding protein
MTITRQGFFALLAGAAATAAGCAERASEVRIGFIVKNPEEPWFQNEWRAAEAAGAKHGFEVIKIGATDGDKVLTAIDNLAAKGAAGFVICAPDTRLGSAIQQRAKANDLKVMSVDDRLLGSNGQPIAEIPHMGISGYDIGTMVGDTLIKEAQARGWSLADVGFLRISYDSLQTAKERTTGARDALLKAGLPQANVFDAPQRTLDTEGGLNAATPVLTRRSNLKKWMVVGLNDETVLGGVRAAEGLGLGRDSVIAVGIGGAGTAQAEFAKADPTAYVATIHISSRRHGYETAEAVYRWVAEDKAPAPLTLTSGQVMTRDNYKALLAAEQSA